MRFVVSAVSASAKATPCKGTSLLLHYANPAELPFLCRLQYDCATRADDDGLMCFEVRQRHPLLPGWRFKPLPASL